MGSLRDKLLQADDLAREPVETPEWAPFGVPTVHVRGLTAAEADQWADLLTDGKGRRQANRRAAFAAMVVVDEDGKREFEEKDADWLKDKPVVVLERIVRTGLKLSGLLTEPDEANPSTADLSEPRSPGSASLAVYPTSTDLPKGSVPPS